jgi:TetR/AcrR family transcriptional regulator, cholesterol catabolism regulator
MRPRAEARADGILDVVIELLESEGYDAVQVRTVAQRARVSLATIYKLFGTRDQLIVTALERWMDANAYAGLTMPEPNESLYDTMVRVLRTVFEPWEQHPRMLVAYHRARSSPGGEQLDLHGMAIVTPIVEAALPGPDPQYLGDVLLIHEHVVRGAIGRFAQGEIDVTEILPILERALFRLTTDNRIPTAPTRPRVVGTGGRSKKAAKSARTMKGDRRQSA